MSDILHMGEQAAKNLVPPGTPKDPRWKYDATVSALLALLVFVVMFHIAWACNWLTGWGLDGFVRTHDLTSINYRLLYIQKNDLSRDLREAKTQTCIAAQSQNQDALTSWSQKLEDLEGQYWTLTKETPNIMGCDDLLVGHPKTPG